MRKAELKAFAELVDLRAELVDRMGWYLKSAEMLMGTIPWEDGFQFPHAYNQEHSSEEYLCAFDAVRDTIRRIDADIARLYRRRKSSAIRCAVSSAASAVMAFLCGM